MAETLVTLRDIIVRYGDSIALDLTALDLYAREMLAIIGPNGSGKSTLLRVMGMLQPPTSGRVRFRGENALNGNSLRLRRRIATVFQEPLLLNATVQENAALGLRLRGVSKAEIARRLEPWLERLGVAHLRARSARSLSGGEAQRVSLARALVLEPEILLLDEPFAALDPASREALLRDFQLIIRDSKITTVFVTHDRNEAFTLAGRVAVLHHGRLLQIGAREEVFRRPASNAVAEIVGVENRLPGVVEECEKDLTTIRVGQNRLKVQGKFQPGVKVIVCLRPEEIAVSRENSHANNSNSFVGTITGAFSGVLHQRMTLDCGGNEIVALVERKVGYGLELAKGDRVTASCSFSAAHLIEIEDRESKIEDRHPQFSMLVPR